MTLEESTRLTAEYRVTLTILGSFVQYLRTLTGTIWMGGLLGIYLLSYPCITHRRIGWRAIEP